jgi:hypothetical protein
MGIFDLIYESRVTGISYCKPVVEEIKKDIRYFLSGAFNPDDYEDVIRLAVCLINVSLKISYLKEDIPIKASDFLMKLIKSNISNCSAAPLIAAHSLNKIYNLWLNNTPPDILLPPDRAAVYEEIKNKSGKDDLDNLLNFLDYEEAYPRISYITRNMKEEMSKELISLVPEPSKICKDTEKIFLDNGFHISGIMDFRELLNLLSLAGELSEGLPLIKYIVKTGLISALFRAA